jgi:myo-inositol-1(or 4)-monophosphatase
MGMDSPERLAFAHRLADAAGAVIRPYFRKRLDVVNKHSAAGFFDPVTEADKRAEEVIRALLAQEFPDDAILGEEFGDKPGTSGFRWVVDPIDGTRAFISGQPMWGTLIALESHEELIFGMIDQPFLEERFVGSGGRAELDSREGKTVLKTRACARLADAVVSTTHPLAHFGPAERLLFAKVEAAAKLSRYGGDCYAYGLVAMGFIDLVMEANLRRWDSAAIIPIVEGAGGVVTDWRGGAVADGGNILAAGDERLHAEVLALLAAAGV